MQHVDLLTVGRIREGYLTAGINEYLKRLQPYARVRIREGPEEKVPDHPSPVQVEQILDCEGVYIRRHLSPGIYTIALDREGAMLSSEDLAARMADLALAGRNDLAFIIGGTLGLARDILATADLRLSFSRFTFPHQLMRLILLEQLYRAYKIQRGETYHR
ncbi:MAG: rRNA (pseudouridine1915-N3)-methyltransferase [Clostridia bacterium]|nr:rRNA (pseudouridine1915-N3)-methyltransferase [Clostridia bacterium]